MSLLGIGIGAFGLVIMATAIGYPIYPHFFFTSVVIIGFLVYSVLRYGFVSVPSVIGGIVGYPALVPFVNRFVFGFPHFTFAKAYEEVPFTNMLLFYVFVFFTIYLGVLHLFESSSISISNPVASIGFPIYYHRIAFIGLVIFFLGSAYLYAPGPTILTAGYAEILSYTNQWATFAGATYKGAWIVLFLLNVGENYDRERYAMFLLVTLIGATWLILHGKRVESVGFFLTIALHLYTFKWIDGGSFSIRESLRRMSPLLILPVMLLVGIARGSGLSSMSNSIMSVIGPDYISFPSGAHSVYHTYQITMAQFQDTGYLWGKTFINYIPQSIPSGFYAFTPFEYPTPFYQVLREEPTYIGGNYILNVYFANFGPIGIIIAGIVIGVITLYCHRLFSNELRPTIFMGIAVVVFSNAFRALWYTQLNWVDTLQGFVVALLIYVITSNVMGKNW